MTISSVWLSRTGSDQRHRDLPGARPSAWFHPPTVGRGKLYCEFESKDNPFEWPRKPRSSNQGGLESARYVLLFAAIIVSLYVMLSSKYMTGMVGRRGRRRAPYGVVGRRGRGRAT